MPLLLHPFHHICSLLYCLFIKRKEEEEEEEVEEEEGVRWGIVECIEGGITNSCNRVYDKKEDVKKVL